MIELILLLVANLSLLCSNQINIIHIFVPLLPQNNLGATVVSTLHRASQSRIHNNPLQCRERERKLIER